MALERTIINQIKTQLGNVNGSGSYTTDLSGADQVVIGESFTPGRIPCALVAVLLPQYTHSVRAAAVLDAVKLSTWMFPVLAA